MWRLKGLDNSEIVGDASILRPPAFPPGGNVSVPAAVAKVVATRFLFPVIEDFK